MIVSCSMKTLGSIASGISTMLIARVVEVCLKEGRKLVIVPREAPLSLIHLQNMVTVKKAGAIIMPASPAYSHKPENVLDMVDFIVARVLDVFGIKVELIKRWGTVDK